MPKPSEYDKTHLRNMAAIGTRIDRIFKKAADEAAKIGVQIKSLHPEHLFSFDDYPETKKQIERLMIALQQSTETAIANGIRSAWNLSNNKNDVLARRIFGDRAASLTMEQARRYFSTNGAALDAFLHRRTTGTGLSLSDQVWKYTNAFKEEIELGLDLGIRSGESAAEMSRDLRQYLQNPDVMFRRFRVREENGDASEGTDGKGYGRKWKRRVNDPTTGKVTWENFHPRNFHPGQGVYRSSYKNARRLAATETNIAYRTADHLRWQQMDFVVGIRVVMSNNHTLNGEKFTDICDRLSSSSPKDNKGRYPKDFKFVGWHPLCRCHVETILKTEEEMQQDTQRILNGEPTNTNSVNTVRDTPAEFKAFAKQFQDRNEQRTEEGLKPLGTPYFISDNRGYFDTALGLKPTTAQQAAQRHKLRTPEERQAIIDRWEARKHNPLVIAANRHAARTKEQEQAIRDAWAERLFKNEKIRRDANRVLNLAKAWQEVDYSILENLIAQGNLKKVQSETEAVMTALKAMRTEENALTDLIPNVHELHNKYTLSELKGAHTAIQNTFNRWFWDYNTETSLIFLKTKLEKEISIVAKSVYKTKDIAKAAFERRLTFVNSKIELLKIDKEYTDLLSFKTKSKVFNEYMNKAKSALDAGDIKAAQGYIDSANIQKKHLELKKKKTTANPLVSSDVQKVHPDIRTEVDEKIEQIKSMTGSTETKARDFYAAVKGFSYQWDWEIRQVQMGNTSFTSRKGHLMQSIQKKADDLEEFIMNSPQWIGDTTYRGISLSDKELKDTISQLTAGTFHNRGSASWSTREGKSKSFANSHIGEPSPQFGDKKTNRVVLILKKQKYATSIRHLSIFPTEYEVLASAKVRYRLVDQNTDGTYIYITVEAI